MFELVIVLKCPRISSLDIQNYMRFPSIMNKLPKMNNHPRNRIILKRQQSHNPSNQCNSPHLIEEGCDAMSSKQWLP